MQHDPLAKAGVLAERTKGGTKQAFGSELENMFLK